MSPSWIWSDKITNERVARVGYNHFISNKGEWNNCLPPIFISTILQSGNFLNLAHYFPYDVKLRLLAHSRSFLANQKARNAIVGAGNLLKVYSTQESRSTWRLSQNGQMVTCELVINWFVHVIAIFEAIEIIDVAWWSQSYAPECMLNCLWWFHSDSFRHAAKKI